MGRFTKLATFSLLISTVAIAANPHEHLKLGPGQLTLVSGNSEVCSDGPFKVVGDDKDKSLIVGPVINFPLNEEAEHSDDCKEKISLKYSSQMISRTHIVYECSKQHKKLEDTVEETLSVKDKTLTYERKSSDTPVKCIFKWTAVEKK